MGKEIMQTLVNLSFTLTPHIHLIPIKFHGAFIVLLTLIANHLTPVLLPEWTLVVACCITNALTAIASV